MSYKLENYLRTYRKRSGLSQDEMAFLLGCQNGTKVSRYERFARKPNLETLFAYEVVFGAPARELFAGVYHIVHYGTDSKELSQTAKSPIRINLGHPETIFRVRMPGLKPQTTYYYKATSTDSNEKSDGVESSVKQFTTPGPGERIVAYPPQPAQPK
jgi:transcriptional regulator with XRE-family HTH domain